MEPTMKTPWPMILVAALSLGLGACDRAESPTEVREDVAEAQQDAAGEITQEQSEAMADSTVTMQDNREIMIARAEGDHRIALERCDSMSGDAQQACKDQADAALEQARAQAEPYPPAAEPAPVTPPPGQ
jgi:hypothetical protein